MSNSGEGFNNVSPFVINDQSEPDDKREESPSSQVSSMSSGKAFNVENGFIALDTSTLDMQSLKKKLWNCDSTGDNSLIDQESLLERNDVFAIKKLSESDYMAIDEYVNFGCTGENRTSSMTKITSTSPTIALPSSHHDDSPIGHSYEIFEAIGQKQLKHDIKLQMNATKNRSNQKIEVLRSSFYSKMTRYFTWILIVAFVIHLSSLLWFKIRDGKKMVLRPLQQEQQFPLKECTATESFCSFSVKEEMESSNNTSLLFKDTHAIDDPAPKKNEQATEIQNRTLAAYLISASSFCDSIIISIINMAIQKDHETPMIKRKITSFILHLCNLFILMAVAMIYALLPRRLNISRCHYWNRQTLLELCNSCRKRGLPYAGILRNDMIRNLCEYEGITNSFPRLDTFNYSSLSKIELKNTLKKLGVATSGVKMDLQYRLVLTREHIFLTWHREELMRLIISSGLKVDVLMDNKEAMARKLAEAGPWILPNLRNAVVQ
jgi:hypothetical protein